MATSMLLRPETLHPLTLASFVLDYRLEGDPLQIIAKRFSYSQGSQEEKRDACEEVTLILTAGIGCNCELWLPTIKHVFHLQSQSNSSVHIRHVWAVEWPNHGDAAVLNESVLDQNYSKALTQREGAISLRRLVRSGLIDIQNSKLVGLSHSAGCGSHLMAVPEMRNLPFDAIILLEPPFFNRSAVPFEKHFIARNITFNKGRLDVWPTLDDAINWHKARAPWNTWHPEVFQVFAETNFRNLPTVHHSHTVGVTPKTYKGQDAASFNVGDEVHAVMDGLGALCACMPVHVIEGSRKDFWPKRLGEIVEKTTRAYESSLASITVVPGAGHYVAQENPHGLATAILQVIRGARPLARL